ncbi:alpha/beta fold hydrolase [Microbulbifer taiwanensis]|uniref:Alpha/beta fold hydrolase n=1 Tax=Microbulbifer taiwanensis TaxID=986746 RepID=A0ABW1YL53_9GAMM|nr:alpha/beta hydrolase [Microbulbifer taiwanensis]
MNRVSKDRGECIVFVHGALADARMWQPHISNIESEYDARAVTLRHFDAAEDCSFGLNTHADDLAGFLKSLHEPAHIVAWSYGADVVLNTLTRHGSAVASVFLYEPGYPGSVPQEKMNSWLADANAMFAPIFQAVEQGDLPLAVELLMDASANRKGYFSSQADFYRQQQLSKAYTLPLQLNQSEQPQLDADSLGEINVDTTIAFGSQSRHLNKVTCASVSASVNGSRLLCVPDVNHMLPQENPDHFMLLVREHLSQIGN